jgi:DNA helicase-2/ATP-dependent DNA helicase PcrA
MVRKYDMGPAIRGTDPARLRIDYQAELNAQQYAAVSAPPGAALVIAGAGSGKTRTLTYRVSYLVENGVAPSNILLLTFTNKAAREMLERVRGLIPADLSGLWSGTFHSVGNRILRRHPEAAGLEEGFSIMDREDQKEMLDGVIAGLGLDAKAKRFPKGDVVGEVLSHAINTRKPLEDVLVEKFPHFLEFEAQIAEVGRRYEVRKKEANSVDFDDLIEKPLRMLRAESALAEQYQRQFQFVLVDEYQDTNHIQSEFIDLLSARHRNLMVVGDDAQSIYSWRGADFRNILEFPKRYPGAQVYRIETNYRSVPEILAVANAAIALNERQFRKELVAVRPAAPVRPGWVALGDSSQQAAFIARRILDLREEGIELEEVAVLYRAHFHSMELQMELTRLGIPFQITSGLRFFEQAHVKDVAAFLKFAVNPRDEVAFKRMIRLLPGIGARSADQIWGQLGAYRQSAEESGPQKGWSARFSEFKVPSKALKGWQQLGFTLDEISPFGQVIPPGDMIRAVLEAVYDDYGKAEFANYDQRREDLNTLAEFAGRYREPAEFLDQLALMSGLDSDPADADLEEEGRVTLSSVHQAKGLEWRAVFVIWLAEGMFPSSRSLESEESVEEERRLFYVAVTRAREELYLTYPHLRLNAGYGEMLQRPSRFIQELPKDLLEEWQITGGI